MLVYLFFMRLVFGINLFLVCAAIDLSAQTKQINDQWQSWFSVNSTIRTSPHWGFVGDFHVRRTDFLKSANFYFARAGAGYWLQDNLSFIAGYAHLWLSSTKDGKSIYLDENRTYQQISYGSNFRKLSILNRFRNEQRWRETLQGNGQPTTTTFSSRLRYLISLTHPVFKNPKLPQACLANEVLLQFGKPIVNNALDQFRLFGGIRQSLGRGWSYDFGYMMVYQQKATAYQYDRNHTLRLFFYYTHNKKPVKVVHPEYEDE